MLETIAKVAVHTPNGIVTLAVPCTVDEGGRVTYELPEHLMRFEERVVLDVMGPDIDMSAFDSITLKPFSSSERRVDGPDGEIGLTPAQARLARLGGELEQEVIPSGTGLRQPAMEANR